MKLVGIHGRARSGKDTLADFLVRHHNWKRIGLADPLRLFVSQITGIPVEDLMDGDVKEAPLPWLGGKSPRQLMQTLGTEWGREYVCSDVWLCVAERLIGEAAKQGYAGVVVPDIRFDNEAEWIKELGGTLVHLHRDGVAEVAGHKSEAGVDPSLVDLHVDNNGPLVGLAWWAQTLAG